MTQNSHNSMSVWWPVFGIGSLLAQLIAAFALIPFVFISSIIWTITKSHSQLIWLAVGIALFVIGWIWQAIALLRNRYGWSARIMTILFDVPIVMDVIDAIRSNLHGIGQ